MENLTSSFREKNLVPQLVQELQIESKIDELELAKKNECIFCNVFLILSEGIFLTFVFYIFSAISIHSVCNWTRIHNRLVHKRTLNQFG